MYSEIVFSLKMLINLNTIVNKFKKVNSQITEIYYIITMYV